MPVVIRVGKKANEKKVRLELNARQALNGDVMIFDHGDIDIVLSPSTKKVVAFPKETLSDLVYGAQNRLMTVLMKKGIIKAESIQAGSYFGALEGQILESTNPDINGAKLALINISQFIEEERPYFDFVRSYADQAEELYTDPDDLHSTELGDVAHSDTKGSIKPGYVRDPYGLSQLYKI